MEREKEKQEGKTKSEKRIETSLKINEKQNTDGASENMVSNVKHVVLLYISAATNWLHSNALAWT
ncbi:hypothetical protein X801_06450 [Opisthorchis viverrini]|uniref:Uncharacterized protein n=1 Tax=Opisthorchis viverrini TaxID=6198 RepID=A0A1S8WTG4_OPIVI|nr:hypothetical protein X801_06450 [Opisthorchis viverrini]